MTWSNREDTTPDGIPTSAAVSTVSYEILTPFLTCQTIHRMRKRIARTTITPYHLTFPKANGFKPMLINFLTLSRELATNRLYYAG
jgi:hypothetical protein